jgi:hypothetical protein
MKKYLMDFASSLIVVFWAYGVLKEIDWIASIAGPILIGLSAIIAYKQIIDSVNSVYAKRAEQMPFLFPPSFVGAGSIKLQRAIALFVGGSFILFGLFNLVNMIV